MGFVDIVYHLLLTNKVRLGFVCPFGILERLFRPRSNTGQDNITMIYPVVLGFTSTLITRLWDLLILFIVVLLTNKGRLGYVRLA